ncbi:uncharacterized protein KIAA1958-like [Ptychodera flava]|uniref:uncharacterized protein KIAA1958-like n=1 Tax=Ptychodera flava TaxID=63121 RepID=UPI00396A2678
MAADDIIQWMAALPKDELDVLLSGENTTDETTVGKDDLATVDEFIKAQRKPSTVRTTERDVTKVRHFIEHRYGDIRDLVDIPPKTLNEYLATFFVHLKKNDGTDYEPGSVSAVKYSLERYLSQNNYRVSLNDKFFSLTNDAIKAKRMHLKKSGLGAGSHASEAISPEEEESLWKEGKLGTADGDTLNFTLWYLFTKHFGLRGRDEHRETLFRRRHSTAGQLRS